MDPQIIEDVRIKCIITLQDIETLQRNITELQNSLLIFDLKAINTEMALVNNTMKMLSCKSKLMRIRGIKGI